VAGDRKVIGGNPGNVIETHETKASSKSGKNNGMKQKAAMR
jgi:hypothetical protein